MAGGHRNVAPDLEPIRAATADDEPETGDDIEVDEDDDLDTEDVDDDDEEDEIPTDD